MHVYGPISTVRNTLDIHQGTNNFAITLFPSHFGCVLKTTGRLFVFFIRTHAASVDTWCVFFVFFS